jgi:hypothetical protein
MLGGRRYDLRRLLYSKREKPVSRKKTAARNSRRAIQGKIPPRSASAREIGKKIHRRWQDLPAIPPLLQQREIKKGGRAALSD